VAPLQLPLATPQTHLPATQRSPGLHAFAQSPQWNGSVARSTQPTPAQQVEPLAHAEPPAQRQVAPEQLSPVGPQPTPQPPQLALSDCTLVQVPLQQAWLASQDCAPQR